MAPLYKKVLIATLLFFAFAGRIAISAMPIYKVSVEISKVNADKSDTNQNDDQLEDKVKLEDLMKTDFTKIEFLSIFSSKRRLFSGNYNLVKCYLQTLEYPPK
ncbi:hypothetical protein ASE74_06615 [Pedobacter sp. Leaf216]|uniref:hypothetical protein n=1 Tax=Pedobacter sp. Leaf216 TaxID=1735684 RepID=UPI0006F372F1|nr:hypothetical protein [Pedobacter sp. Leaf216]KQM67134.1 hypothetical protein ASE74_06615 [Pedobacter sp. Leaf216]